MLVFISFHFVGRKCNPWSEGDAVDRIEVAGNEFHSQNILIGQVILPKSISLLDNQELELYSAVNFAVQSTLH